jgi:hypothetical protein
MSFPARHRGTVAALSALLAVSGIIAIWMAEPPAKPRRFAAGTVPYTISQETTWITEPLRPDGAVDYVAALNQHLSEGVTPENNAVVLLMEVMGSGVIEPEIREEFYRHLGVPVPETTEGALESYWDFLGEHLKSTGRTLSEEERGKLHLETFDESYGGPWQREKFSLVAEWLEENEPAIDLIVEASDRHRMYLPIVVKDQASGLLDYWLFDFKSNMRQFARILSSRFSFFMGEGEIAKAQRDLLALHRLGSLMGSRASVIDSLVGSALDAIAAEGDLLLAQSEQVTADQLAHHRQELANLPPFAPMSEMFDLTERYGYLDIVRTLTFQSNQADGVQINVAAEAGEFLDCPQVKIWKRYPGLELDWDLILKIGNSRFDQTVAALEKPTFAEQRAELAKIKSDVMKLRDQALDPRQLELLAAGSKPVREVISRQFGQELAWMMIENSRMLAVAEMRAALRRELTIIALALAEYKLDHGSYPAELSELAPKYLDAIPLDGFTQEPLKYQRQEAGYLLYSVGANGKDDQGLNGDEADDIAIRVPKPAES